MIDLASLHYHSIATDDVSGHVDTSLLNMPRTIPVALAGVAVARGKVDKYIEGKLAGFSDQQMVEFLIALVDAVCRRNPSLSG